MTNVCNNRHLSDCESIGVNVGKGFQETLEKLTPKPFVGYYNYFNGAQWLWAGNWMYYTWVDNTLTFMQKDGTRVTPPKVPMRWNVPNPAVPDTYPSVTAMANFNYTPPSAELLYEGSGLYGACAGVHAQVFKVNPHMLTTNVDVTSENGIALDCAVAITESMSNPDIPYTSIHFILGSGIHTEYNSNRVVNYTEGDQLNSYFGID